MTRPIAKAIVPAAGLGTRLLPATKVQPKEMLPVGRKPVVQWVAEELQAAHLTQILIITGRHKRAIEDHLDADPQLVASLKEAGNEAVLADLAYLESPSRFVYIRQSEPKGLGHAVSLCAEFVDGDDCVVALGDSLITANEAEAPLPGMIRAFQTLGAAAMVAVEHVPPQEAFRYGVVGLQCADPPPGEPVAITDIVEKPAQGTAPSDLSVAARYVFSPAIFEALARVVPDRRGEIQLTDAIKVLIQQGLPVYAWPLATGQVRYDIGNFESYYRAFVEFALADERYGYLLRKYIKARAYEL